MRGKTGLLNRAASPHVETFLRPHLIGPFSDLLIAAVTSPLMLLYLDQIGSVGPNSERVSNCPDAGLHVRMGGGSAFRRNFFRTRDQDGSWQTLRINATADIHQLLTNLARHPATAQHIATKLAQNFV